MKEIVTIEYVMEVHHNLVAGHHCIDGIRDGNLLASAVGGQYWYDYGIEQIIHVAYSICANHVFADGNKRTAFLVLKLLEIKLGLTCDWTAIAHTVLALAADSIAKSDFRQQIIEAIYFL